MPAEALKYVVTASNAASIVAAPSSQKLSVVGDRPHVVSTPSTTAGDTSNPPTTPTPVNPEIAALQAQIALLNQAANAP